jgi:protein SCO1/2
MVRVVRIALSTLLVAVLALGWMWYSAGQQTTIAKNDENVEAPVLIGGPFTLTNQDGQRVTDKDFRGRYLLVFFGYTYCPDTCPTTLSMLSSVLDKLGPDADKVAPVFITVDPDRDSAASLKSYLKSFDRRFIGLRGSAAETAAVAKAYRVFYRKRPLPGNDYAMDHTSLIYLMNPDGKFEGDYAPTESADMIAADLTKRIRTTFARS